MNVKRKKKVSARKLPSDAQGTWSFITRGRAMFQRARFTIVFPLAFFLFLFEKTKQTSQNALLVKTDSYLGSELWSRNENPVADQQYRFYQINMSDMESFQNRAVVRQCSLLWQLHEEKREELAAAFTPYTFLCASQFCHPGSLTKLIHYIQEHASNT